MSRPDQVPRDGDTKIFEGGHLLQWVFLNTHFNGCRISLPGDYKVVVFMLSFRCLDATQFEISITSDCTEMNFSRKHRFIITGIISKHPVTQVFVVDILL